MKVNVFLNGEEYLGKISSAKKNIVCDGAYEYCVKNNIKIDVVLGDFDSLGYVPNNAITFKVEKDFTDGEAAVELVKNHAKEIVFYNFGGLREDHFLGNLSLLVLCSNLNIMAKAVTNYSQIYFVKDKISLKKVKGKTISIVPFGQNAHILNGKGLKYSINNLTLRGDKTLGISNVATSSCVEIEVGSGAVFVFVNN